MLYASYLLSECYTGIRYIGIIFAILSKIRLEQIKWNSVRIFSTQKQNNGGMNIGTNQAILLQSLTKGPRIL